MALSTATTTLNYGVQQVETATIIGTIVNAGNATVTVTGAGITGSPVAVSVAVLSGDTAIVVASKATDAINLNANISAVYSAVANGATIILTRKVPATNDGTLNIASTNGTCTGLTAAPTSVDTTAGVALAKLVDINNYPDMGSTPSKLDTTTLTEPKYKTSIFGLQEIPDLTFECNYDETKYATIAGLMGTYYFQILFGTSDGVFSWSGGVSVFATGGGVDEVRKMTVTCSAITPIVFATN